VIAWHLADYGRLEESFLGDSNKDQQLKLQNPEILMLPVGTYIELAIAKICLSSMLLFIVSEI